MSDDIDLQTIPPLLPGNVARVDPKTGLPTKFLLNQELAQNNWFSNSVVELDQKTDEISGTIAGFTGTINDLTAVVQNADGSLTAGKLSTISAVASDAATLANDATASGQMSWTVTAAPTGYSAAYALTLTASGVQAGIYMLVDSTGNSFIALSASNFLLQDPNIASGIPSTLLSYSATYGAFIFNVPVVFNGAAIFLGSVNTAQLASDAVTTKYDVPKQSDHSIYPVATGPAYTSYAVIQEAGVPIQGTFTVTQDTPIEVSVNPAIFYQQAAFKLAVFKNGVYEAPLGIFSFSGSVANYCGTASDTSGVQGSLIYKSVLTPGTWTLDVRVSQLGNVTGQSQTRILAGTRITMLATKR